MSEEKLTLNNFHEATGHRFRVTKEQHARILAGEITREQALQEFIDGGGLKRMTEQRETIPSSVLLDPSLTVENFRERTGRRFRRTKEQVSRGISPQEALAEMVASAVAANQTEQVENV
jgi:hypothetical protein